MLVRITQHITGSRDGALWPEPGGQLTVPADEAAELVALGLAEVIPQPEPAPAKRPVGRPRKAGSGGGP